MINVAKIKIHPSDPRCFMYWDIATQDVNCFWVTGYYDRGWQWNGDFERPTVTPSILNSRPGFINHVYITNGKIEYLNDCTHDMAGQRVDMVDFPEDW